MLRPRIAPLLLLKSESLVKTIRFSSPRYVGDPFNAVTIFNAKGVDELIIVDIDAPHTRTINFPLLENVAKECTVPLVYGGGITTIDEMKQLYRLGIEKIILNSAAHSNPKLVRTAAATFGSQAVMVGIDYRQTPDGSRAVFHSGGTKLASGDLPATARLMQSYGAGELLLQSIDRDGTWEGLDVSLIRQLAPELSIPVTAAGGAGSLADIQQAVAGGASEVAVGSMSVFQGQNQGVLINFPSIQTLTQLFNG